jgi:hypothetical protein
MAYRRLRVSGNLWRVESLETQRNGQTTVRSCPLGMLTLYDWCGYGQPPTHGDLSINFRVAKKKEKDWAAKLTFVVDVQNECW